MKYVLKNCTNIEDWIVGKAISRREQDPSLPPFVYPYNLGRINNLKEVNIIINFYIIYNNVQVPNLIIFIFIYYSSLSKEMAFIGKYEMDVVNMI